MTWQVLVVDDDEDIREGLGAVLVARGFRAVIASNGNEALALLQSGRVQPSVVLLDMSMPGCSDFLALQANDPNLARIPVVVVTGAEDRTLAPFEAVRAIVTKPFDLRELITIVRDVCANGTVHRAS